ncbi:DUF4395 domain-containing protein [Solibacillus silvestris]|uniref:DUF4395 domain-containing protein n=1 Tax=Solibacillus silvestris TaxID=76853 RepID=UPI003F7ED7D7
MDYIFIYYFHMGDRGILAIGYSINCKLLGIFAGFNPITRLAKIFLMKDLKTYIPEDGEQQKFNSKIASICLAAGLLGFIFHVPVIAYSFTIMVAVASFIAILGFCIGCFIHFQLRRFLKNF